MEACFEARRWDGAGRLGRLQIPRRDVTVQTPALLPVINPRGQSIPPARLQADYGIEMVITNAYIIYQDESLRKDAREQGVHGLIDFDGPVMMDSGSFQLAEYGTISVDTDTILPFQREIGADIGTPVDIPTPPDAERDRTTAELETTRDRLETARDIETGDMLVSAPIQGSTYPDLRRQSAEYTAEAGLDIAPIGGVVPLLNDYRFRTLVDVVIGAKQALPTDQPVHLFGAGHPMMFALATAMGCDLFDSAAYALYAAEDRYLTTRGTHSLDDLTHFPCSCDICRATTPEDLQSASPDERERRLAEHNLAVTVGEIQTIREAIAAGTLFELLDTRCRAHPALLEGYRRLLESRDWLEKTDPTSKASFFYTSHESAYRPAVDRYHDRLDRLEIPEHLHLSPRQPKEKAGTWWRLQPPFGPIPPALAQTYPCNMEAPKIADNTAIERALEAVERLTAISPATSITISGIDWAEKAREALPDSVEVRS